jgi:chitin disaccharide deacetylase
MCTVRLVIAVFLLNIFVIAQSDQKKTVAERLGYPANARLLIIHADDLGMSHSVNRATFEGLEKGWITSSSILVPCPWFPEVVEWAKKHPEADLGIHMALNSEWTGFRWTPLSPIDKVQSLVDENGYLPVVETVVVAKSKPAEVEMELRAQIDKAKRAGIHLTHLDSHMVTLLRSNNLYESYNKIGKEYGLPLLLERNPGPYLPSGHPADYALIDKVVAIDVGVAPKDWLKAYQDLLRPLPPGTYELIVHTAYDDDEMRGATWDHPAWGAAWRQLDFDLVKSPEFRQFLKDQNFTLVSWKDLQRALPDGYIKAGK